MIEREKLSSSGKIFSKEFWSGLVENTMEEEPSPTVIMY
jgi:hypothetical protein